MTAHILEPCAFGRQLMEGGPDQISRPMPRPTSWIAKYRNAKLVLQF